MGSGKRGRWGAVSQTGQDYGHNGPQVARAARPRRARGAGSRAAGGGHMQTKPTRHPRQGWGGRAEKRGLGMHPVAPNAPNGAQPRTGGIVCSATQTQWGFMTQGLRLSSLDNTILE